MLELFVHSSPLIKSVLIILTALSVVSWGIILYKYLHLQSAAKQSEKLVKKLDGCESADDLAGLFKAAGSLQISPAAALARAVSGKHRSREETQRILKSAQAEETDTLESYLIYLATVGSTAPFIGLLGTVWGIMDAFKGIGTAGSASLAVVAPAISEALVTTAAGLAAAIPSVMAYNFFLNWIRKQTNGLEAFSENLQSVLARKSA